MKNENEPEWVPNPEWENAGPIHIIAHPGSGIVCQCEHCRNKQPIKPGTARKIHIAKVDCSGKYILDKDGNWLKQEEPPEK